MAIVFDAPVRAAQSARLLLNGDEAVALAALDAGITYSSAYPGTPATDIQEYLKKSAPDSVRVIWSINEKVAYESALAVAISGQRALVSMKQVGLNVAADAFVNSCPAGVNGGLVLAVGDDPECHSSQNKQDTRHYRALAGNLLLEPSSSQEAYSMTREAFRLSEEFKLPVILRLTTRTAYCSSVVEREPSESMRRDVNWPKEPARFFIVPSNSRRLFVRLARIQPDMAGRVSKLQFGYETNQLSSEIGIIATGIGAALAEELAPSGVGILKIAGEPFPSEIIRNFVLAHDRVLVLEEGDPVIEARAAAFAHNTAHVYGRLTGDLKAVGELQPGEIQQFLTGVRERPVVVIPDLPPRLPEICKPCGYNKVFAALKMVPDIATPSDIGCNTLGGLPPYSVMDGVWAMGASIGVACGLAAIGHPRVLAIIGDSTFFHAGIPPLIEAVQEGHKMTVLLLDNGTAAMTGGQSVPHAAAGSRRAKVDLVRVIEALGIHRCTPFDPHKLGIEGIRDLVEHSFEEDGVKVLLYRSQCGLYSPGYFTQAPFAISKMSAT